MGTLGTVPPLVWISGAVGAGLAEQGQNWRAWAITVVALVFLGESTGHYRLGWGRGGATGGSRGGFRPS